MTAGTPPFYAEDPMEVYEKILSGHVSIPLSFSRGIGELVKKLPKTCQSKRLSTLVPLEKLSSCRPAGARCTPRTPRTPLAPMVEGTVLQRLQSS